MNVFEPRLSVLPPAQRRLWPELDATPEHFTLYGGTALALRLGHRISIDFDFFSNQLFLPDQLITTVPYLEGAEQVSVAPNTLTCRVERDGPILVSFFGGLKFKQAEPRERVQGRTLHAASLLDIAGTKMSVIQKRAEAKDYIDIDALIQNGLGLEAALRAAKVIYGPSFNPLATLKALCYFEDMPDLPLDIQQRLAKAVQHIDLGAWESDGAK